MLVGVEAARRAGERGCCVCTRFYWGRVPGYLVRWLACSQGLERVFVPGKRDNWGFASQYIGW